MFGHKKDKELYFMGQKKDKHIYVLGQKKDLNKNVTTSAIPSNHLIEEHKSLSEFHPLGLKLRNSSKKSLSGLEKR